MNTHEAMTLIWSDGFEDHATGNHPERPERIPALKSALQGAGLFDRCRVLAPEPATVDDIALIHDERLIELVRATAESGGGWLDPDTYVSPASYDVALLAAGAAMQAVSIGIDRGPAFAFVRPPGHHAEPGRAMGFCLFNNVAVAVAAARKEQRIGKVAILDWDVHHGNGTQAAFWDDPDVLFVSLHQYPFYPGTGADTERGGGDAVGTTINIPLAAGAGDGEYERAFEETVLPGIRAFEAEAIVISAGFDAHVDDPLAQMRVTTDGFRWMAHAVSEMALELCEGRLSLTLEGGYNLQSIGEAAVAVIEEMLRMYPTEAPE